MPVKLLVPSGITSNKAAINLADLCYQRELPDGLQVRAIGPLIDKIGLTCPIENEGAKGAILKKLSSMKKDAANKTYGSVPKGVDQVSKYQINAQITLSDRKKVLIQAGPKQSGVKNFMRFEFNPRKLGITGMEMLRAEIKNFSSGELDWSYVAINCTVWRLDVAVDLIGLPLHKALVTCSAEGKGILHLSADGKVETKYFGVKKGKSSAHKAYNKAQETTDKGYVPDFAERTRIEVKISPQVAIPSLIAKKHNPFAAFSVAYPVLSAEAHPPTYWQWFIDSCRLRGASGALNLLSPASTAEYLNALESVANNVWDPKRIWGQFPAALASSGLMP